MTRSNYILSSGAHVPPQNGSEPIGCAVEIAAWRQGMPWSDHSPCVHPTLAAFVRGLFDAMAARNMLDCWTPDVLDRLGNSANHTVDVWCFVTFAVRDAAPVALERVRLPNEAAELRSLPAVSKENARAVAATAAAYAVRAAAYAALAAAYAAADAAARAAAYAAADASASAAYAARAARPAADVAADADVLRRAFDVLLTQLPTLSAKKDP